MEALALRKTVIPANRKVEFARTKAVAAGLNNEKNAIRMAFLRLLSWLMEARQGGAFGHG